MRPTGNTGNSLVDVGNTVLPRDAIGIAIPLSTGRNGFDSRTRRCDECPFRTTWKTGARKGLRVRPPLTSCKACGGEIGSRAGPERGRLDNSCRRNLGLRLPST